MVIRGESRCCNKERSQDLVRTQSPVGKPTGLFYVRQHGCEPEHGVAGVFAGVLGFKPDFPGLNVDQAFGVALEAQRLDVRIFDVFFALGVLQLGIEAHSAWMTEWQWL